jgi:hypothetical protein
MSSCFIACLHSVLLYADGRLQAPHGALLSSKPHDQYPFGMCCAPPAGYARALLLRCVMIGAVH